MPICYHSDVMDPHTSDTDANMSHYCGTLIFVGEIITLVGEIITLVGEIITLMGGDYNPRGGDYNPRGGRL